MKKRTLVATDFSCRVENVRNEPCLVIENRGLPITEYKGSCNYAKKQQTTIYLPLWAIPYLMEQQRKAVGQHCKEQQQFIARIKEAYSTTIE